jgi:heme A synthase
VLFLIVTAQMAAGIATLVLGGSGAISFVHEIGAAFLLAGAFVALAPPHQSGEALSRA